jgi:hypothetical protein
MAQSAHNLHPPGLPIEITPGTYEISTVGVTQTMGPDGWTVRDDNGSRIADPDRAAHEIDPDGWHRANPTRAIDCPYCAEATTDDGKDDR